jgi:hypothetical protein
MVEGHSIASVRRHRTLLGRNRRSNLKGATQTNNLKRKLISNRILPKFRICFTPNLKFTCVMTKRNDEEAIYFSSLSISRKLTPYRSTGNYCDLELASLRNETNETTSGTYDCSDCILGPMKIQLEAPVAYGAKGASAFASLTASCQATGYSYTQPSNYALNSTTAVYSDCDSHRFGAYGIMYQLICDPDKRHLQLHCSRPECLRVQLDPYKQPRYLLPRPTGAW